ncbi:hypothetical protein LTR78_001909 [Recurvomyces mirabilis]|uniref:Uncharacterized protein n=1 Tax=Recurvomyces mirabilis TaxID=574656 RepID=A0AAE0WUS3_9PEZI|nr:hypothetical protein LTR78_001909 [Recurvomyces mirabilis]KAK5156653.1 hypothetical protein LTS14_004865 [Recurvomyces mirabilis]
MNESMWAPKLAEETQEDKNESRPTTSLSAHAPSFSPAPPPPDVSTDDAFGQTGAAQDDLFDDIVPVDESMRIRSEDDLFSDDFTPAPQPVVEQAPTPASRGRGDGQRARGDRGRGGRGRGRGGNSAPARTVSNGAAAAQPAAPTQTIEQQSQPESTPPANAPTGPREQQQQEPKPTPAVRGSRHATGGSHKPKLTEAELTEKMAKINLNNANRAAAHERAEADAASFAEREAAAKQQAVEKAKVESNEKRQLATEREKNRIRKLKAQGGREWDEHKEGGDFEKGGRFDGKGFGRDQEGWSDGREYLLRDEPVRGGGRGRGGRAGGQERAPMREDFPALPDSGVAQPRREDKDVVGGAQAAPPEPNLSSSTAKDVRSWADQVESANANA